jgi:ubiquinone/menaquinone biosynthesis C-methylase UbiE
MDHFKEIYATKADLYDRMVTREDYQNNLLPALESIYPLKDAVVIEFGAGTGRLTRLLAPQVKHIHSFDFSLHMLQNAVLPQTENWTLTTAENSRMPLPNNLADIAIEGWSFGHITGWYPQTWREEMAAALAEMRRVTRSGGVMVILETLGTGSETPNPPNSLLADFYQMLETEQGFSHTWIRTDYQFESVEEADELTRFFFGEDFADRIVREGQPVVPECTGIWFKQV